MKKMIAIMMLVTIAACNTIEGAGEDITAAGKAISNSSQKTKKEM